ncbi:MAG: hypothetical protein ACLR9X_07375 [Clostridia bacterium]
MPESCSIKSTKTQINDAINKYYGGNKIFKDNLEKHAVNASLGIMSKVKPLALYFFSELYFIFIKVIHTHTT